jgi:hypothetical protein
MSSFLEYAAQFEVKENEALTAFTSALKKQKAGFEKGDFTRRSWVKQDGTGYSVKLGKLGQSYFIPEKKDVSEFLQKASIAATGDPKFQALVEAAYASPVEEPVKRRGGRKPWVGDVVGNG